MRRGRDAQDALLDCADRAVGGPESSESSSPLAPWPVAALDADAVVVGCSTLGGSARLRGRVVGRVRVRGPDIADDSLRRGVAACGQVPGNRNLPVDRQVSRPASGDSPAGRRAPAPPAGGFRHGETRRAETGSRERSRSCRNGTGIRWTCGEHRRGRRFGSARRLDCQRAAGTGGGRGHRRRTGGRRTRALLRRMAGARNVRKSEEGRIGEGGGSVEHVGADAVDAQELDRDPVAAGARGLLLDAAEVRLGPPGVAPRHG